MNNYYVYIISNSNNTVLYTWVTNDLIKRIYEHKNKIAEWFSKEYNLNKLLYFEAYNEVTEAIKREKQLKKWRREWKENLINKTNINKNDLYESLL